MNPEKLYKGRETADFLGLSTSTLEHWRLKDKGPQCVRVGAGKRGTVRYRGADILAFVNSRQSRGEKLQAGA